MKFKMVPNCPQLMPAITLYVVPTLFSHKQLTPSPPKLQVIDSGTKYLSRCFKSLGDTWRLFTHFPNAHYTHLLS